MPRDAIQSTDFNYEVSQVQLAVMDGPHKGKPSGFFGNVRNDNGAVLGVTSEQYGIIQNDTLMNAALEALNARGMTNFKQRTIVAGSGERFYNEFIFEDKNLKNAVGDIFGYKLTLKNSFDRTTRAAIELGFMRLVCTNGMATLEKQFNVTQKHSSSVNADFIGAAIDNAVTNGKQALCVFDDLAKVRITNNQGLYIIKHLERSKELSGKVAEGIAAKWVAPARHDRNRNLYNLYNAATDYLTHEVATDRYEFAATSSSGILLKLVNASRKPAMLEKLTAKVDLTDAEVMASN